MVGGGIGQVIDTLPLRARWLLLDIHRGVVAIRHSQSHIGNTVLRVSRHGSHVSACLSYTHAC